MPEGDPQEQWEPHEHEALDHGEPVKAKRAPAKKAAKKAADA
jgi:hypothetical protein